jgi:hypothetical protein
VKSPSKTIVEERKRKDVVIIFKKMLALSSMAGTAYEFLSIYWVSQFWYRKYYIKNDQNKNTNHEKHTKSIY